MKLLLDHCVPAPLRRALPAHEVRTARQMGWDKLQNGKLLAEGGKHFDVFLSVDMNIAHQQNLDSLPIAVVILNVVKNTPECVLPLAPFVERVLPTLRPGQMVIVDALGNVTTVTPPRP